MALQYGLLLLLEFSDAQLLAAISFAMEDTSIVPDVVDRPEETSVWAVCPSGISLLDGSTLFRQ